MDKVYFKNIEDLRFRHCFSLLKTWPKLFGDKRPLTVLSLDDKPKSKDELKEQANDRDMQALGGLKSITYFFLVLLFSNYLQLDLVNKSRWKEIIVWVLTSGIYLQIDQLLFLIALVQTNRMLKYFRQLDKIAEKEKSVVQGEGMTTYATSSGPLFLLKQYFKIIIFAYIGI